VLICLFALFWQQLFSFATHILITEECFAGVCQLNIFFTSYHILCIAF
jgi:hypothetical protein